MCFLWHLQAVSMRARVQPLSAHLMFFYEVFILRWLSWRWSFSTINLSFSTHHRQISSFTAWSLLKCISGIVADFSLSAFMSTGWTLIPSKTGNSCASLVLMIHPGEFNVRFNLTLTAWYPDLTVTGNENGLRSGCWSFCPAAKRPVGAQSAVNVPPQQCCWCCEVQTEESSRSFSWHIDDLNRQRRIKLVETGVWQSCCEFTTQTCKLVSLAC